MQGPGSIKAGSVSCMVLGLESRRAQEYRGLCILPPVKEGRRVQVCDRAFLCGPPERPLCEAVKVKPGLCWKLQDVIDARARTPAQESCLLSGTSPREKCIAADKAGRSWRSEEPSKPSDISYRRFRVCVSALLWPNVFPMLWPSDTFPMKYHCAIVCWKYVICLLILLLQGDYS